MLRLRLYVAGASPHSVAALANLKALAPRLNGGRVEFEVVDVLREPLRALTDAILVTPTLVRLSPLPECRVLGDLRDVELVLRSMGAS